MKVNPIVKAREIRAIAEKVPGKQMPNQAVQRVLWKYGFHGKKKKNSIYFTIRRYSPM